MSTLIKGYESGENYQRSLWVWCVNRGSLWCWWSGQSKKHSKQCKCNQYRRKYLRTPKYLPRRRVGRTPQTTAKGRRREMVSSIPLRIPLLTSQSSLTFSSIQRLLMTWWRTYLPWNWRVHPRSTSLSKFPQIRKGRPRRPRVDDHKTKSQGSK